MKLYLGHPDIRPTLLRKGVLNLIHRNPVVKEPAKLMYQKKPRAFGKLSFFQLSWLVGWLGRHVKFNVISDSRERGSKEKGRITLGLNLNA